MAAHRAGDVRVAVLWAFTCLLTFLFGRASVTPALKGERAPEAASADSMGVGRDSGARILKRFRDPDRVGDGGNRADQTDLLQAEARKVDELRRRGEFILEMEEPGFHEAHQATMERVSARVLREREEAGFRSELAQLGMDSEQIEQAERHLSKIAGAAVDANQHLIQLKDAQLAFDARMRKQLSEEGYRTFRESEQAFAARSEVAAFKKYIDGGNLSGSPELLTAFSDLLRQTRVATVEKIGGPYDSVPVPAVGVDDVRTHMQRRLESVQKGAEVVQGAMRELGYPDSIEQGIVGYYRQKEEDVRNELSRLENWEEESQAVKERLGFTKRPSGP
ncbi:MAG: hypothetical protein AB7J34_10685 [Limisphaerales bacterium]